MKLNIIIYSPDYPVILAFSNGIKLLFLAPLYLDAMNATKNADDRSAEELYKMDSSEKILAVRVGTETNPGEAPQTHVKHVRDDLYSMKFEDATFLEYDKCRVADEDIEVMLEGSVDWLENHLLDHYDDSFSVEPHIMADDYEVAESIVELYEEQSS